MHPVAELSKVAGEFRHLQAEHAREGVAGSWRRRQRERLEQLEEAFERLLQHWVPDADEQERWRDHLYRGAAQPRTVPEEPPIFRGRSELGSTMLVRPSDGEYDVLIDGAAVARWPMRHTLDTPVRHGDSVFHEQFKAPPVALEALLEYVERRAESPPWSWAPELYDDGLIDSNFGLTPRGRRFRDSRR